VTVIGFQICYDVPSFIKIGSRVRHPGPTTAKWLMRGC